MTTTEVAGAPIEESRATVPVSRRRMVRRAGAFGLVLAVAAWRLEALAVGAVVDHSPYVAFLLAPLAAAVVALWRQANCRDELDVHDRQVDFTLAVLIAALAFGLSELLSRRLGTLAPAMGLATLALPLWAAAAAVALFGTRPTRRHVYSLFVLALVWPLPFNAVGALIPAPSFGWFVAATIVAVAVGGVLVGSRRRVAAAILMGVAAVVVEVHLVAGPGAVVVGVGAVLAMARLTGLHVLPRPKLPALLAPRRSPAVPTIRAAIPVVACLAVAAALTPSATPSVIRYPVPLVHVAEVDATTCPSTGGSWVLVSETHLGNAARLGAFPTVRCRYRDGTNPPAATLAIDLSAPEPMNLLAEAPFDVAYRTPGAEGPIEYPVDLPRGSGTLLAYDSPSLPLTTVVVTGLITSRTLPAGDAQRYAVIVTDDPLSSSPLPDLSPHLVGASLSRLSEIVRISPQQARLSTAAPKNADDAEEVARVVVTGWESG